MNFLESITRVVTKSLTPAAATPAIADTTVTGRHAVEVAAVEDCYVGGPDVTADTGIPVKAGTSRVFPVNNDTALYVIGGKCVIADYF